MRGDSEYDGYLCETNWFKRGWHSQHVFICDEYKKGKNKIQASRTLSLYD